MLRYCRIDGGGKSLMQAAARQMDLSARAYHRTLKLARTIADLAGAEEIDTPHLAEALQYRPRGLTVNGATGLSLWRIKCLFYQMELLSDDSTNVAEVVGKCSMNP